MPSDRERYRARHIAALDLIEAWIRDQDADLYNIADNLVQEPQAACYALARITDAALQLWAEATDVDRDHVFATLRTKIERDLTDNPRAG